MSDENDPTVEKLLMDLFGGSTDYSCGHNGFSAKAYTIRSEPEKHYCSKACAMIYDPARYFEQVKQDRRTEARRESE
jgi:hypothetical protein